MVRRINTGLFETYEHVGAYGYHWWVLNNERFHIPYCMYFAMGYGGQYIIIIPQLELVAVISSHMPKTWPRTIKVIYRAYKKKIPIINK